MYCPPESGNIDPSSAKAAQAHSEIAPPRIQTRKNQNGWGNGPAMSLAVRKIEEPMMPLTSSRTESSRLSPRTRLGFSRGFSARAEETGAEVISTIPYPVRQEIQAACRNAGRSRQNNRRRSAGLPLLWRKPGSTGSQRVLEWLGNSAGWSPCARNFSTVCWAGFVRRPTHYPAWDKETRHAASTQVPR